MEQDRIGELQDELTGALIGLVRATFSNPKTADTDSVILSGLSATVTRANFNREMLEELVSRTKREKDLVAPGCVTCEARCGNTDDYDMSRLWNCADEEVKGYKTLILLSLRAMSPIAYQALLLGKKDEAVIDYICRALFAVSEDWATELLKPVALEAGTVFERCRQLL